jgi:RNase adaptor protein for sRNA GlmZ degradation
MPEKIYIVSGVPASGKSWVCNQLKDLFEYVAHDGWSQRDKLGSKDYLAKYARELLEKAKTSAKPVLGDCPFSERELKELLEKGGATPKFIFLKASPADLVSRYKERNKPLPKGHITRQTSIPERAKEWGSFYGASSEALDHLKDVASGKKEESAKRMTHRQWREFNR